MKSIYYLLIFLVVFSRCNKDNTSHECIKHKRLTDMQGQSLFNTVFPFKEMPYFNPNNANEIIYRYSDGISPEFDLVKYNLVTKGKNIIFQGSFANRPRWGKKDWILLNIKDSNGYNIYKIKSNGDSLTSLTNGSHCFNPEWNFTSDKFIYELGFTSPTKYILANHQGEFIDTLFSGLNAGSSWQHKQLVATGLLDGLVISNPYILNDYTKFEKEALAQSLNGAEWLDEERVFWCHTTGIYMSNIVTKETLLIRETCNAHCYQRPTYSRGINKIIVEKLERILDTETSGRIVLSLVMMNPDGTDEVVIE